MSAPHRHPAQAGRPGTVLLVAVALMVLGIVGMHALSDHGTQVTTAHLSSSATAASSTPTHHEPGSAHPDPAGEHTGAHGLALCLALLAGLGAALLLPSRWAPRPWLVHPRGAWGRTSGIRPAVRATGPPPVWSFSVIRC